MRLIRCSIAAPYNCLVGAALEALAALVARMQALAAQLADDGDPARYFLGTYLRTTLAVRDVLAAGRFEDPGWVEAWDVDFAGLYLDALTAFRRNPACA